jgi:hypothetical protein
VRSEWRAKVLDEVRQANDDRAANRPGAAAVVHGIGSRRSLVLSWPIASAAAVVLFAAGATAARIGGRLRPDATPAVASTAALPSGTTRFVLVAPNAQRVALVGDFNLWDPAKAPMRRMQGSNAWVIDLPLSAGRHVYAFVVDGDVTADPSAPRTGGDDFGRPNSVVLVSPQS